MHRDATYDKLQGRVTAFNHSLISFKVKSSLCCAQERTNNLPNLWSDLGQSSVMYAYMYIMFMDHCVITCMTLTYTYISSDIGESCWDGAENNEKMFALCMPS